MLDRIWYTGALLIGLVPGCVAEGSGDSEVLVSANQAPVGRTVLGNAELKGAVDSANLALIDESRRLTMSRRLDFHVALADQIGLTGDGRKEFLRLHAEEEEGRLADSPSEESADKERRAARAAALAELLGADGLERYFELKKDRSHWYRRSTIGREVLRSSLVSRAERSAR